MLTLMRFRRIEALLREAGYGPSIDWSEAVPAPASAEEFAGHAIYVICNSGMKNSVAEIIYERCMVALAGGMSASLVFGHSGKSAAMDFIWADRDQLFDAFQRSDEPLSHLRSLPWVGPITSFHLLKNLGGNVAKPDVHLERLAQRDQTTTERLCQRLAKKAGYRVSTVDTILWRACAAGLLNSKLYAQSGWRAAFQPDKFRASHK